MSRVYIIRLFSVYGGARMKANKAKIIDLMCAKDLTLEQLAKGCGVRNCTITAILRGSAGNVSAKRTASPVYTRAAASLLSLLRIKA